MRCEHVTRIAVALVLCGSALAENEIGYIEVFSLAEDRDKALEELIPGTDNYYYYHCLHYQNTGQFAKYDKFLNRYIERYTYNARVNELRYRQALINYEKDPEASLEFIRKELQLYFNHRRRTDNEGSSAPTRLDPTRISASTLTERALRHRQNLHDFEAEGLDLLCDWDLNGDQRRDLLSRLRRPDYPELVNRVIADLKYKHSGGLGSQSIHGQMLLNQLDELVEKLPELRNHHQFVNIYVSKLQPRNDVDLRRNVNEREAYYERLWEFASTLKPVHNSLKANVLYNRLDHDRRRGVYHLDRFLAYIKLPRNVPYVNRDWFENQHGRSRVDLNRIFPGVILPPVGNEEPLVNEYLAYLLKNAKDYKRFASFLDHDYLKRTFSSTKILNGIGDVEDWASLLSPSEYKALKERVDLDFSSQNPRYFGPDDNVQLDLFVKNANDLILKVFEINTLNYYRETHQEVNLAVNLDGLVAFHEERITYEEAPTRRIRHTFEFPQIRARGAYVIEFIGNGKSSRALIQKGRMHFLEEITPAGHAITVLDERNRWLKDASVWLGGRQFVPEAEGVILIPFSTKPGNEQLIMEHGRVASLAPFRHLEERYDLRGGFYVDREALLKREKAHVLVRPVLRLNGMPVSLKLLEDVRLIIDSVDLNGVSSRKEVSDFTLFEDRESVYEFHVPEQLSKLSFSLVAQVHNVSRNKEEDVTVNATFELNQIDRSAAVEGLHVTWADNTYYIELRGKNGEPKPAKPLSVDVKHRLFKEPVHLSLQTDAEGRCELGALQDIAWFRARGPDGKVHIWHPVENDSLYSTDIHAATGDVVRLPYLVEADNPLQHLSLLDQVAGNFTRDWKGVLSVHDGFIEARGLPAGDYDLFIKPLNRHVTIRIATGKKELGHILSDTRYLQIRNPNPLSIGSVDIGREKIEVKVANATPFSRVHVLASRYVPQYDLFDHLHGAGFPGPMLKSHGDSETLYVSGRNVGDEYRYVLERRFAKKFPGTMLHRPGLLLNPWAIRSTEAGAEQLAEGEAYRRAAGQGAGEAVIRDVEEGEPSHGEHYPNLDFLAHPAVVLANLVPDKEGVIRIDRKALRGKVHLRFIAIDPENTVSKNISLADTPVQRRELRLTLGLHPHKHFAEQKLISIVDQDQTFIIEDVTTSDMESYDSLSKVYKLFATLSGDSALKEFAFIQRWPALDETEKRDKYSKYACHELSFFLYHKDPDFFESVIAPYLRNKKDKTFLDHWLLGIDLTDYLQPWEFSRLNIVERILLGQRMESQRPSLVRHVNDLNDLLSPDIDRFNVQFDTAVKSSALEVDQRFDDFAAKVVDELSLRSELDVASSMPVPSSQLEGAFAGRMLAADADGSVDTSRFEEKRAKSSTGLKKQFVLQEKMKADKDFFRARAPARERQRRFFQKLDKTEELVENNYYRLPLDQQAAGLITVNNFWNDYASHDGTKMFLSSSLAEATRNFSEMMLALAVLDLPFAVSNHTVLTENTSYQLVPRSPLLVFHKEIREWTGAFEQGHILVSENFFRADDRYRYEDNDRYQKYVTDEFLRHVVYGSQIILTNPTENRQKLNLLLQIPKGAMPVQNGFYTRGQHIILEPYSTTSFDYFFYFPETGSYPHYPVHVAKDEALLAHAVPFTFNVVEKLSQVDTNSWAYVSQHGTDEDVIEYLQAHNLARVDLAEIAWRMKNKEYFNQVCSLVKGRHFYNETLWSYGIYHDVLPKAREFLRHSSYADRVGDYIDTQLLRVDPVARRIYQHMEYEPLVNPRAHQVGQKRTILNHRFREQYQRLMKVLSYRANIDHEERLAVTYYLLIQDRIEEALAWFSTVSPTKLTARLQYDYLKAYISVYQENLVQAREIARQYLEYPVPRWRNKFQILIHQLEELQSGIADVVDAGDRQQAQDQLAATEASLEFTVEGQRIKMNTQNIDTCLVNFYPMDIELLFSRNPFILQQSAQFSFIRPVLSETLILSPEKNSHVHPLPEAFRSSNVMVEVVAGGIRKAQAYYANDLAIQVIETYGQIKVRHQDSREPLSKVYVKVYARMHDGRIRFIKDGYTDLRGRFDYVSLNTNELDEVEKLSILILSEEHGAAIRESLPPKR